MGVIAFPRKNLLSKPDIRNLKKHLRSGDILLLGNLRTVFSSVMPAPVTHVAVAENKSKIIHSTPHGVEEMLMKEVFTNYDTAVLLRPRATIMQRVQTIKYAKSKIGKPYNFLFEDSRDSAFCSAFANKALLKSGITTGLKNFDKDQPLFKIDLIEEVKLEKFDIQSALRPSDFLKGEFDIKYISHNLQYDKKEDKLHFSEHEKNLNAFISNFELDTDNDIIKAGRRLRKDITAKFFREFING